MPDPKQIIHIRIRDLRRQRALTQEELAAALGISRQSINAMEAGRALPSLPVAMQIASFFSVPLTAIFELPDERPDQRALVPWNPIQDALDEMTEEAASRQEAAQAAMPAVNVYQTDTHLVAEFYVPGFSKDQLDSEVGEDFIRVRGLARSVAATYLHREIALSSFERTLNLQAPVRHLDAKAEIKNGVLTIRVPKAEGGMPRSARIAIEGE